MQTLNFGRVLRAIVVFCGIGVGTGAAADSLTAREVAEKMLAATGSADSKSTVSMTIDRKGQTLVRKLIVFTQTSETGERRLFQFLEPSAVRDTKYLVWSYEDPDRSDDIWMFLPSQSIVRRLSGGGKKGAFMRSDMAVEDLENSYIDDHNYRLSGSEIVSGNDCYVLEMTNKKDSNYGRQVASIRKDIWLPLRIDFYDRHDRHLKTALFDRFEEIQGIWTATRMTMDTPRKNSRTIMEYEQVEYNSEMDAALFRKENLKR